MNEIWRRLRRPLIILAIVLGTVAVLRIVSGPEDTWIRNDRGEWIKHGNPSAPKPVDETR